MFGSARGGNGLGYTNGKINNEHVKCICAGRDRDAVFFENFQQPRIVDIIRLKNNLYGPILVGAVHKCPEVRRKLVAHERIFVGVFAEVDAFEAGFELRVGRYLALEGRACCGGQRPDVALCERAIKPFGDNRTKHGRIGSEARDVVKPDHHLRIGRRLTQDRIDHGFQLLFVAGCEDGIPVDPVEPGSCRALCKLRRDRIEHKFASIAPIVDEDGIASCRRRERRRDAANLFGVRSIGRRSADHLCEVNGRVDRSCGLA